MLIILINHDDFDKSWWFWMSKSVMNDQLEGVLPESLKLCALFNMSDLHIWSGGFGDTTNIFPRTNMNSKPRNDIANHKKNDCTIYTYRNCTHSAVRQSGNLPQLSLLQATFRYKGYTQVTSWHLPNVSPTGVMASLSTFLGHNLYFFNDFSSCFEFSPFFFGGGAVSVACRFMSCDVVLAKVQRQLQWDLRETSPYHGNSTRSSP